MTVLRSSDYWATWVTSWPYPQYVKRAFTDAWVCSIFRTESENWRASHMILEAISVSRFRWLNQPLPQDGIITFINPEKIQSTNPGYCFKAAGFVAAGHTNNGLVILRMPVERFPEMKIPNPVLWIPDHEVMADVESEEFDYW